MKYLQYLFEKIWKDKIATNKHQLHCSLLFHYVLFKSGRKRDGSNIQSLKLTFSAPETQRLEDDPFPFGSISDYFHGRTRR